MTEQKPPQRLVLIPRDQLDRFKREHPEFLTELAAWSEEVVTLRLEVSGEEYSCASVDPPPFASIEQAARYLDGKPGATVYVDTEQPQSVADWVDQVNRAESAGDDLDSPDVPSGWWILPCLLLAALIVLFALA